MIVQLSKKEVSDLYDSIDHAQGVLESYKECFKEHPEDYDGPADIARQRVTLRNHLRRLDTLQKKFVKLIKDGEVAYR